MYANFKGDAAICCTPRNVYHLSPRQKPYIMVNEQFAALSKDYQPRNGFNSLSRRGESYLKFNFAVAPRKSEYFFNGLP